MDIIRTIASCVVLALVVLAEDDAVVRRSGLVHHSVKLSCSIPHSQPPRVIWNDRIYTSTPEPILIFQSENNSNFQINGAHPNRANYAVDRSNFELRISNLSYDDSGEYSCISESGGQRFERNYYLTVHGNLICTGETRLKSGQTTTLTCKVAYSGKKPALDWLHPDGHKVSSTDKSDLTDDGPMGEKELNLTATHDIDHKAFSCRMDFGDKSEDCHRNFNVTYPVRDVEFSTTRNELYPGEEVVCTARGNPAPEVSLVPTSGAKRPDDRVKSHIIIPKKWEGSKVTIECTAKNTYNGTQRTANESLTFLVLAATTPTTVKTTPKPTEPVKPVVDGDGKGSGDRLSAWMTLSFLAMTLTLLDPFSLRC